MGPLLKGKIAKIVIYDQARVNGGSNYKYTGKRWVLKLVKYKRCDNRFKGKINDEKYRMMEPLAEFYNCPLG